MYNYTSNVDDMYVWANRPLTENHAQQRPACDQNYYSVATMQATNKLMVSFIVINVSASEAMIAITWGQMNLNWYFKNMKRSHLISKQ